jgi:hypothetical protein
MQEGFVSGAEDGKRKEDAGQLAGKTRQHSGEALSASGECCEQKMLEIKEGRFDGRKTKLILLDSLLQERRSTLPVSLFQIAWDHSFNNG